MCDVRYALRWESHEEEGKRREEAAEKGSRGGSGEADRDMREGQ